MNKLTLAGCAIAVAVAAGTGGVASPGKTEGWYRRLRKPRYQPPSAVFPVVWTALYTDLAGSTAVAIDRYRATGRDDRARDYTVALGVNLILNASWSWLFFRFHKLGAAVLGAAALTASSADLVRRTAEADQRAGRALLPYPLWCGFATVLSTHIWRLNR